MLKVARYLYSNGRFGLGDNCKPKAIFSVTITLRTPRPRSQIRSEKELGIASNVAALITTLAWRSISDDVKSMNDIYCPWTAYIIHEILSMRCILHYHE